VCCNVIQVGAGQRINVTMYDYSYSAALVRRSDLPQSGSYLLPLPSPTQARTCRVYATIREPSRGSTTTTVCDMRGRVVNVFTSDADRIELRIMTVTRPGTATDASSSRQPPAASRHDATVEQDSYVMFHYTGEVLASSLRWTSGGYPPTTLGAEHYVFGLYVRSSVRPLTSISRDTTSLYLVDEF